MEIEWWIVLGLLIWQWCMAIPWQTWAFKNAFASESYLLNTNTFSYWYIKFLTDSYCSVQAQKAFLWNMFDWNHIQRKRRNLFLFYIFF